MKPNSHGLSGDQLRKKDAQRRRYQRTNAITAARAVLDQLEVVGVCTEDARRKLNRMLDPVTVK